MKKTFYIFTLIAILFLTKCGLPGDDFVEELNSPVIIAQSSAGLPNYYITIKIQAYQPESNFTGINIYVIHTTDSASPKEDLKNVSNSNSTAGHFYENEANSTFPNINSVQNKYIISAGTETPQNTYPTITTYWMQNNNATSPVGLIFPQIQSSWVEFEYVIKWRPDSVNNLISGKYYIGVTAVDDRNKKESVISNIVEVG